MSHKRKGQLTSIAERAKHLRKYMRRRFWKGERKAEGSFIRNEMDENKNGSSYISDGTYRHSFQQLVEAIAIKHQAAGITVFPPANPDSIHHFEKQVGFTMPGDFKLFYSVCNGFECTDDIFNFKPLFEFLLYEDDYGDNWFYFCEYMINSDLWGVRCFPDGSYEIFNAYYPSKSITTSLELFLHHFLRGGVFEPGGLYAWQEELGIGEFKK
jgi:hypothetical protein